MEDGAVLEFARHGITTALMVSMPVLAVTLFIGVLVSIFQAITQVQEATLTFVPKMVGVAAIAAAMGSWMLTTLVGFLNLAFDHIARMGH